MLFEIDTDNVDRIPCSDLDSTTLNFFFHKEASAKTSYCSIEEINGVVSAALIEIEVDIAAENIIELLLQLEKITGREHSIWRGLILGEILIAERRAICLAIAVVFAFQEFSSIGCVNFNLKWLINFLNDLILKFLVLKQINQSRHVLADVVRRESAHEIEARIQYCLLVD